MKKALTILLCLSAAFCANARRYAVVDYSVIYMRLQPDYESGLETQELMGSIVEILEEDRYWRKIRCDQPYTAWCTNLSLIEMTPDEIEKYKLAPKYIFTGCSGKVYEKPSDKSPVISDLVMGDILRRGVPGSHGKFRQVVLPSGRKGYVPAHDLMKKEDWEKSVRDADGNDIVALARRFLGTPYLWGGMSTKGFDCSGLVRTCYMMNGIYLPRNAREMVLCGKEIPLDTACMKPGDLLFFGNRETGAVTHIGMYTGDGHFIHSSHVVRINSMNTGDADCYESINRLLCCRRITGN